MYILFHSYIFTCNHLQVILSSGPPQPIDLLSAYLFIYMYIYIYVCVCIYVCIYFFTVIYLPAITCSHSKSRPSQTYWPTVCLPIYLCIFIYIYMCVCVCVCICFFIYIFTCNHLQSFKVQTLPNLLTYCLPSYWSICTYIYLYVCMYVFILIFKYLPANTCSHFKFRPSRTYWPIVCQPIHLCVFIYIYVCVCIHFLY